MSSVASPYSAQSKRSAQTRRGLILHDVLAFLALLAVSVALFGVTLFLFRSFQGHREDLAREWSARGRAALARHQPDQAVSALRNALSYAPDDRADQLLLAQSLADANHTEEATNYFLTLWDARPGDGFINLELARLARQKGDAAEANDYYRASIYGSWEGDGTVRRRQTRFELAEYLIEQHQNAEARNLLYTLSGNFPSDEGLNMGVASLMARAGYMPDALTFYEKASSADPHARAPLAMAGKTAYELGEYARAERLLARALDEKPAANETPAQALELTTLAAHARRIQELTLTRDQPARERADHLLLASGIAQNRLKMCITHAGSSAADASMLASLNGAWIGIGNGRGGRRALLQNADAQDTWSQLIYQTETDTEKICGAPTGDDALLLQLAQAAGAAYGNGREGAGNGR